MDEDSIRFLIYASCALLFSTWSTSTWSALNGMTRGRLRRLDASGEGELADRAEKWLDQRDRYRLINRILTLTGVAIGVISVIAAFSANGTIAAAVWLFIYFCASEISGGLTLRSPWRVLSLSIPIVNVVGLILSPIIVPIQAIASAFQIDTDDEADLTTTTDEIVSLVEQDAQQETKGSSDLEDNERRMILGVMDLDETYVKEIMTPRVDVQALSVDSSIEDLKQAIITSGHSRIPVYNENVDDIIGVVYSRDLHDEKRTKHATSVRPLMHAPVFVPETKAVSNLLEELKQQKVHMAIVIDEYGGTAGLVTIEDILEEIVGEIRDEYDQDEEDLICELDESGVATVDARLPIDQINSLLQLEISVEEDFDTIGGYVASELGRIPKTAEEFAFGDLKCTILAADQRKISRLQLFREPSKT